MSYMHYWKRKTIRIISKIPIKCTPHQHLSQESWDLIQPLISRGVPIELHCRKNQHRLTSMTILIPPFTQYWKILGAVNFWERSNYRLSSLDKIELGRLVFRIQIYSYFIVNYRKYSFPFWKHLCIWNLNWF